MRFGDKAMRHQKIARDRTQNRIPLLLIARFSAIGLGSNPPQKNPEKRL